MNKLLSFAVGILIISPLLSGCNNNEVGEFTHLNNNIESEIKIKSKDNEYKCKILHTPEGLNTLTFNYPKSLEGFTISRNCGKYEVVQKELQGEYMKDPLPEDSGIRRLMDILDTLNREESEFNFKSEEEGEKTFVSNGIEVVLDKKGNIIRILIKDLEMEIEFER